jgi:hypothetical protein
MIVLLHVLFLLQWNIKYICCNKLVVILLFFPIFNLIRLKSKWTSTIKKFVYFLIQAEF